jgi:hypothetical protein
MIRRRVLLPAADPEVGKKTLLRNVGNYLLIGIASNPTERNSSVYVLSFR